MSRGAQFTSEMAFFKVSFDKNETTLEVQTRAAHGNYPGHIKTIFRKNENPGICKALKIVMKAMLKEGAEII
ncbi:MAG: hypothetical protein Q7S18_03215 [bacterium]|nr:hypothetical protein [bacterium]